MKTIDLTTVAQPVEDLLDWDRMVAKVDSWVPRDHVDTVRLIANDINAAIAGFIIYRDLSSRGWNTVVD